MAVMTTQFSEPVALDQKTHPVPSSDTMALDLDINGTSIQETNHDPISKDALNDATLSPSNDPKPEVAEVNGTSNNGAFSSNQVISTNTSEPSFESQPSTTTALDQLGLQDTNTTVEAEADLSASFDNSQFENTLVSAESAIESAVEDIAPTSTIPPVVEAPESDLRDATPPPAPESDLQGQQLDDALDFGPDDHTLINQTAELDVAANASGADITFDPQDIEPQNTVPEIPSDLLPPQPSVSKADSLAQGEPDQSQADKMDTIMDDAPPPVKLSREREDDDEAEPSAKRTKTEDAAESSQQDTPMQNGNGEREDGQELTDYGVKEIIKVIKAYARSAAGKNFRAPVAKLWPNFAAAYAEKIKDEIDLETIEHRLRDKVYHTMRDLENAIQLLYDNALTFNGPDHPITIAAKTTQTVLLEKIKTTNLEPPPPVNKNKKKAAAPGKRSTPPVARRASRGSHGATLPTPQPTQTFALDPTSNTPLIRRDSTKLDGGRPKREIHPPKNKDLPYSVRPKSKKHASELKFCEDVLTEMNKPKHGEFVAPFQMPVDPVALNIPHYFTVIKKPMDLSTISKKLKEGSYTSATEFDKDMRLMIANALKFNPLPNPMYQVTKQMEDLYLSQWERKDQYLADRSPPAASPSGGESEDEDDEEEEAVVDTKATDTTLRVFKDRLVEEQSKLITLMGSKNPDQGLIQMQQDMVGVIQKRIKDEEAQVRVTKSKKKAPKAKKSAPLKKSNSVAKKGGSRATPKYMGTLEKETISAGLGALPDDISNEVLQDIKRERPGLDAEDDGTLELDIDVISVPLLWKIHGLIMQYAPDVQESISKTMAADHNPKPQAKAAPKKKNKPMSKYEQERNIETLSKAIENATRGSSGSQEPSSVLPTVEQADESSGDEESDSEEE